MLGKPRILSLSPTRLINSIKHDHSCKILYIKSAIRHMFKSNIKSVSNARLLLQICDAPERNILLTEILLQLAPYEFNGVELWVIGR